MYNGNTAKFAICNCATVDAVLYFDHKSQFCPFFAPTSTLWTMQYISGNTDVSNLRLPKQVSSHTILAPRGMEVIFEFGRAFFRIQ